MQSITAGHRPSTDPPCDVTCPDLIPQPDPPRRTGRGAGATILSHKAGALPDSISVAGKIEFPTGTGTKVWSIFTFYGLGSSRPFRLRQRSLIPPVDDGIAVPVSVQLRLQGCGCYRRSGNKPPAVSAAGRDLAVAGDRNGVERSRQRHHRWRGRIGQQPDPDALIVADADQCAAVGSERDAIDVLGLALEHAAACRRRAATAARSDPTMPKPGWRCRTTAQVPPARRRARSCRESRSSMRPSAPAVAAQPSRSSATALTASAWKRNTCSAAPRASDRRIAVETKLPEIASVRPARSPAFAPARHGHATAPRRDSCRATQAAARHTLSYGFVRWRRGGCDRESRLALVDRAGQRNSRVS
jgi:hypothetical protein